MSNLESKQVVLKPQDLLVVLKVAVNPSRSFLLSDLANELSMALSMVHGCIRRAEMARLVTRSTGSIRPSHAAIKEFVLHGAKYAFPGQLGTLTRGMPTAVGGPSLVPLFETAGSLMPVWPDPEGTGYGPALVPLHASVPVAARKDRALYEVLALLDALRVGAAREREVATQQLEALL